MAIMSRLESNNADFEYAAVVASSQDAYIQDGLVSMHNHDFMRDPAFCSAYARGVMAAGKDYKWHWRVHIGLWASSISLRLDGDYVECGVNAGFMSSSIMHYLNWNEQHKTFYLLDTFSGIDHRYVSLEEASDGAIERSERMKQAGIIICDINRVKQNFSEWQRVKIIQGVIPKSLEYVRSDKISFLHIDLNCAAPEVASIEYFWDRLVTGAPILLDDYAYHGYHHQKSAIDILAKRLGVNVVSLPTGQGLLFKI